MLKRIKNWRIGDYFRQFSIVTAGVVVTFVGSHWVSQYATDKEIESTMRLLAQELENNKTKLNVFIEKHENDRIIAKYFIDNKFDVRKIAIDTLIKYKSFISQLSSFRYSADALDVLKGSSLMQKIENKDLLLSLINTYQGFKNIQESVGEYYDLKQTVLVPVALSTDRSVEIKDVYTPYELLLSGTPMQNFCIITTGFFDPGDLHAQIERTDALVARMAALYE